MLLHFVIIGAQKSASTLLHRCLAQHPEVYMPAAEVPSFEDPDYGEGGMAALEALFPPAAAARVRGIKRPDYLARPECPERIRRHAPDAKLLATLRNPVSRAVSAYYHYMGEGWIPVRPPDEGLSALLDGRYQRRYPRAGEILEFGLYHQHLQHWDSFFDRERMFLVLQEDLATDLKGTLRAAHRFLGISEDFQPTLGRDRAKAGNYSLPRLRYLQLTSPLTRTYNATRTRNQQKSGPLYRAVLGLDTHLLSRLFPQEPPTLDPALRQRLADYYEADTRGLEQYLQRPLDAWLPGRARGVAADGSPGR